MTDSGTRGPARWGRAHGLQSQGLAVSPALPLAGVGPQASHTTSLGLSFLTSYEGVRSKFENDNRLEEHSTVSQ